MNKHLHNKIVPQCSSEAGFTLIEMLVAMTIASIFFVSFTAVVVATIQTMKIGDQRTVAQQNARIAINFLADEIKQMSELEPPSYYEYRDTRTGGFPANGECEDMYFNNVYPYVRQSTDGSLRGYIDLNHADASAGIDEYEDFRDDGMPYDVRPLFPNKINFKMNQASYFPHTRYSNMKPPMGRVIDLDGMSHDLANGSDNAQAANIRVTFEHQKQPPRWGLIHDEGLLKDLYLPILGEDGGGVNIFKKPFVLLRSFEIENITADSPNNWELNETISLPFNLVDPDGNDSGIDLTRPTDDLRQIVADHIADIRLRYFHIRGGEWIEIRYDPYTDHIGARGGSTPNNVNDGYYRYYTKYGDEIFSWASRIKGDLALPPADATRAEIFEHWEDEAVDEYTFLPTNEFERGLLLFEGWRYVNTIMITIKGANTELQEDYFTSTAYDLPDVNRPDFGLGFVDFQKGSDSWDQMNTIDPLWHALDSYREGLVLPGNLIINPGDNEEPFDFVDPNGNAGFDPGRFVTLQTIVSPPVLYSTSREAVEQLQMGLSFI